MDLVERDFGNDGSEIGAKVAVVDELTGANIIQVSSGWGDGVYPTFVGYTAAGEVACFVTDFQVIPDEDDDA
ncbi:MAG: hypothetical protein QOC94_2205 [Actinoplanes sp.]|jgi:hypothetical protein|nr:hypothetical protein [Actinoplanes sp.]